MKAKLHPVSPFITCRMRRPPIRTRVPIDRTTRPIRMQRAVPIDRMTCPMRMMKVVRCAWSYPSHTYDESRPIVWSGLSDAYDEGRPMRMMKGVPYAWDRGHHAYGEYFTLVPDGLDQVMGTCVSRLETNRRKRTKKAAQRNKLPHRFSCHFQYSFNLFYPGKSGYSKSM
jgi:hypothetical protein